jgi:hypothetical protein
MMPLHGKFTTGLRHLFYCIVYTLGKINNSPDNAFMTCYENKTPLFAYSVADFDSNKEVDTVAYSILLDIKQSSRLNV